MWGSEGQVSYNLVRWRRDGPESALPALSLDQRGVNTIMELNQLAIAVDDSPMQ